MNDHQLLDQIKIASPCPARWAEMAGDDRARFCAQCEKHVFNLSAMTAAAAAALIREKEGKLCARLYRRRDGTVLTADCPVGRELFWQRTERYLHAAAAAVVIGAGGIFFLTSAKGSTTTGKTDLQQRVELALDQAMWKVKTWLGITPPITTHTMGMVMGDIAPPPPPPSPP